MYLSYANLEQIELGTFSSRVGLEKLVWTNNTLKELDFGGFLNKYKSALKNLEKKNLKKIVKFQQF